MKDKILEEFREILSNVPDLRVQGTLDYVAKCLDSDTPSHETSIVDLVSSTHILRYAVDEQQGDRYEELIDQAREILFERGHRENYLTYQEHIIRGSTLQEEPTDEPYKPLGIIEGKLTIEEANKARELARKTRAIGEYFGIDHEFVPISLELLDENGNTVREPQVLDDKLNPVETKYSSDFPFRRG